MKFLAHHSMLEPIPRVLALKAATGRDTVTLHVGVAGDQTRMPSVLVSPCQI
jgi:hypothetical protein